MKRIVLTGRGIAPTYRIPYEEELNDEQLPVVLAGDGPILVIAGAGSGKTRTLTYRVARLVESGVAPEEILLLTFTQRAAREMIRRVEALLGANSVRVVGGTFHHVGNVLLRRYAEKVGYAPSYSILDRGDTRDLMRTILAERDAKPQKNRLPTAEILCSMYSFGVNTKTPVEDLLGDKYLEWAHEQPFVEATLARYEQKKRELQAMDYDDLLVLWLRLMEEEGEAEEIRGRFRYLLVDEYQDTNKLQGSLVDAMVSGRRNLTVVGDDAQSIYGFRGAHFENIISFPDRYGDAKIFRLRTNYRSTPEILALANASIAHNQRQFKKELKAVKPPGALPGIARCADTREEASLVAELCLLRFEEGWEPSDIAILYRSNYQSLEIQAELTRRHISFVVYGGIRFFEQAHVKDVVAHLRAIHNPADELAWMRILALLPRIGQKRAARLIPLVRKELLAKEPDGAAIAATLPKAGRHPFLDFFRLLLKLKRLGDASPGVLIDAVLSDFYEAAMQNRFPNWRRRREDLERLMGFAGDYQSVEPFLSELSLLGHGESPARSEANPTDGSVVLSTIHQAKGLEWPCVMLVGANDGAFPSAYALREATGEEEERRLFYVACTRAAEELLLSYPARTYTGRQGLILANPSRFLSEIPPSRMEPIQVVSGDRGEGEGGEGFAQPEVSEEELFRD